MAKPAQSTVPPLNGKAIFYMVLLAFQFGIQPILTRRYAPTGVNRSAVVLMQEAVKFVIAFMMLYLSGSLRSAVKDWTIVSSLMVAGLPASLYTVQNMAALLAYQNLDALTFNVLNQTKTLSAALCLYLIMGRKQSGMQVVALFLLLTSALVMEGILPVEKLLGDGSAATTTATTEDDNETDTDTTTEEKAWNPHHVTYGLIPILTASFISGLAGALTQRSLQAAGGGRNSYLFSMELCAATTVILTCSLLVSPDGKAMTEEGFWRNWTPQTWIPVFTNASGGVLVGLVTKYAGSVRKGFALIFGMLLSGVMQALVEDAGVSPGQITGGVLAATSLYLHATNPPAPSKPIKQD